MKPFRAILLLCLCFLMTGCWGPYWGKKHWWNSDGTTGAPIPESKTNQPSLPPTPQGYNQQASIEPAVAQPPSGSLRFTTIPATNFDLYASASASSLRSGYVFVAHATNSLTLLVSSLQSISNSPGYTISLVWDKSKDNVLGYRIYSGMVSNVLTRVWQGRGTNATFSVPDGLTRYYVATSYNSTNESVFSNEIASSATPIPQQSLGKFFCAITPTPNPVVLKMEMLP